jgi:hypothetical protein
LGDGPLLLNQISGKELPGKIDLEPFLHLLPIRTGIGAV